MFTLLGVLFFIVSWLFIWCGPAWFVLFGLSLLCFKIADYSPEQRPPPEPMPPGWWKPWLVAGIVLSVPYIVGGIWLYWPIPCG